MHISVCVTCKNCLKEWVDCIDETIPSSSKLYHNFSSLPEVFEFDCNTNYSDIRIAKVDITQY